jgi:hypothetical protein
MRQFTAAQELLEYRIDWVLPSHVGVASGHSRSLRWENNARRTMIVPTAFI